MPRLPDNLLECIVYLYPDEDAAKSGKKVGGTGFLVEVRSPVGDPFRYVITNAHITDSGGHWLRLTTPNGVTTPFSIPPEAWRTHNGLADIAAARIEIGDQGGATFLDWNKWAANIEGLTSKNIGIGDDVFMVGRFIGHDGTQRNSPIVRFGNIATMTQEEVLDGRGQLVKAFLMDMRSIPGFSGSPVFLHLTGGTHRGDGTILPFNVEITALIGIDTGHKMIVGKVMDRNTGKPVNDDWRVSQNSGIAVVAPVWQIRELLEQEEFVDQRKEQVGKWLEDHEDELATSDIAVGGEGEFRQFSDLLGKVLQVPKSQVDELRHSEQD